jgi:pilus assembly protein CpaB
MRRRPPRVSRVLLFLAVLVGAAATIVLRGHLQRVEARARAPGPSQPVVVAATSLSRGTVLQPSMVRTEEMPPAWAPPGALEDPTQVVGRILGADVVASEVLTAARLAPPGGPVASLVPPGLRAVPVTVSLPPGSVVAGDRVDVMATFPDRGPRAETLVAGAEVLAVLSGGETDVGTATTLVLLVGPETSERLAHARAFADLSVAVAPPAGAS